MNWIEQLGEVIKQLNTIPKAGSTAKEPPETKKREINKEGNYDETG
jgi:hypothetical protein